ncbi:MAG: alpha/beta hydrolase, partial [Candidatus Brocadiia bacterium]
SLIKMEVKVKILAIIGIILLVLFSTVVLLMIASAINHKNKLKKESIKYPPPGKLVRVNNHRLHVYGVGQGNTTLIFLAGHGTCNPIIDFKPLWIKLKDEYRIVIVEKAGYGWSEISNNPRDIDTVLEETRKALQLSGEKGPYVLVPHSMSGLEAIYWAQRYHNEVKAHRMNSPHVVGLRVSAQSPPAAASCSASAISAGLL